MQFLCQNMHSHLIFLYYLLFILCYLGRQPVLFFRASARTRALPALIFILYSLFFILYYLLFII